MSDYVSLGTDRIPQPIASLLDVMNGFEAEWCLCGGWALDAWLGMQTREHHDVDIAVFEERLPSLARYLEGWHLVAHDEIDPDSTQPWEGRPLVLPAHVHARRNDYEIDVQVNKRSGPRWQINHSPRITRSIASCVGRVAWGLPALAPEIVLFYKALDLRDKDESDITNAAPRLTRQQIRWLNNAIARTRPDHPWLARLKVSPSNEPLPNRSTS